MNLILTYIRRHIGMFATALFFLSLETLADLMQPTFMWLKDKASPKD